MSALSAAMTACASFCVVLVVGCSSLVGCLPKAAGTWRAPLKCDDWPLSEPSSCERPCVHGPAALPRRPRDCPVRLPRRSAGRSAPPVPPSRVALRSPATCAPPPPSPAAPCAPVAA
eukprot:2914139-Prymnesium_polylepis.1